jgi:hypothetical protein
MEHSDFRCKVVISFILAVILDLNAPAKAQAEHDGATPQFLFPDFTSGKVRMKNGNFQVVMINFNTVSEKIVFKKDDNLYDIVNTEMIDTVFIQESKFVPAGKVFYEVLLGAPISLFIQYQGKVIPSRAEGGYGVASDVSSTSKVTSANFSTGYYNLKLPQDYTVKVNKIFWIRKENNMFSYITEKQFLKLFPEKETEIKDYIKNQKIKFDRLPDQIRLLEHCNEMVR